MEGGTQVKLLPLKCVALRITTLISWCNNPQTLQQRESTHIIFRSQSLCIHFRISLLLKVVDLSVTRLIC